MLIEKEHLAKVALKDQQEREKTTNRLNRPDNAAARYNSRQEKRIQDDKNRVQRIWQMISNPNT
jgi:hypothetical protein